MTQSQIISFIGYHGTSSDNEKSILENCFLKSSKRIDWYGEGAYFFTNGISAETPVELASKWAVDNAWDNKNKAYSYTKYMVFECLVTEQADFILDLREHKGLHLFNVFRNKVLEKLRERNKVLRKNDYMDKDVFDDMKQFIGIKVIIGNVFIKFADLRRISTLRSNIPNVTMFCVNNTENEYINAKEYKVVTEGEISL